MDEDKIIEENLKNIKEIIPKKKLPNVIRDDHKVCYVRPLIDATFYQLSLIVFYFYTEYSSEMFLKKRRVLDELKRLVTLYGKSWPERTKELTDLAEIDTVVFKRAKRWVKENFKEEIIENEEKKKKEKKEEKEED